MTTHGRWATRLDRTLRALDRLRRNLESELTSRMLVAAMLIPIVEVAFGWRTHTPLDASLAAHSAILIAVVLLAPIPTARERRDASLSRGLLWLPVPLVGVALAVVLNLRSNIFYSARTLMEGMTVLIVIHYAGAHLRSRAAVAPTSPALRVADALTTTVGWSLVFSWLLIALEHRHPVGPILIAAGGLELLALVVLIPDALPPMPWGATIRHRWREGRGAKLKIVRGDEPRPARFAGIRRRKRA